MASGRQTRGTPAAGLRRKPRRRRVYLHNLPRQTSPLTQASPEILALRNGLHPVPDGKTEGKHSYRVGRSKGRSMAGSPAPDDPAVARNLKKEEQHGN
jgi:hypothetical protein